MELWRRLRMRRSLKVVLTFTLALVFAATANAAKYKEEAVSNGGSVQGTITYNGVVKTRTALPTKDKEVCGKPRKIPLVMVGDGGAVQDAVVYLKDVESGKAWPDMQRPVINNIACIFEPHVQVARRGKVDILNSDPVLHNTHGYYGKATAFNVALPFKDAKVTKILKRFGPVRTDCDAHGWMLGWVVVVPNPYFMQTGGDGTFSITDVPPGDYTLVVWQEQIGETETPVTIKAGATTEMSIELGG